MVEAIEAEEKKRQQKADKDTREMESKQKTAGTMLSRYEKSRTIESFAE